MSGGGQSVAAQGATVRRVRAAVDVVAPFRGSAGPARVRALARLHWPVLVVLVLAVIVRLGVAIAYRPALFFSDSWRYIALAFGSNHFAGERPSGYPALLVAISAAGRRLAEITAIQHAAGIGTGIVVYALVRRFGAGRWLATAATALVVLDAYAIVLEQTILAEAFFTLTLVVNVYLVTARNAGAATIAASGLLFAAAATMRTAALFAVPIWLGYVAWRHRRLRTFAVAACALAVPLLGYAALYDRAIGRFGLTEADGWFLYGRVAGIADCRTFDPPTGTRQLCEPSGHRARAPVYYVWSGASPANRAYGGPGAPGSSSRLRRFAMAVIRAHPFAYARLVGRDVLRYFEPGAGSPGRSDTAISLPAAPRTGPPWLDSRARDAYFPEYRPAVHTPAGVMRSYLNVVHPPRPLVALLVLATLASLAAPLSGGRVETRHRAESLLLTGMGLAMLLGATATSAFIVRYLEPSVPLIVSGGTIAAADLAAAFRRRPPGPQADAAVANTPGAGRRSMWWCLFADRRARWMS